MSRTRTVFFDFDGVIVESLSAKTAALRAVFADYPEHVERVVALHEDNLGVSRYEKFRVIYRDFLRQPLDDAQMRRLDGRFSRLVYDRVVACPFVRGASELLERVSRDHVLFIASATPEEELRRIVAARGLSRFFTGVHGSPRSKEQIVRELLADSELISADAVFVGDALNDHAAAAANGVRFVGRVVDPARDPFCDLDVDTVADLSELDARWYELVTAPKIVR